MWFHCANVFKVFALREKLQGLQWLCKNLNLFFFFLSVRHKHIQTVVKESP